VCVRGASELQRNVLEQERSPNLRAYVVWLPMFRDMERDVPDASTYVADERAKHYWDGHKALSKVLTEVLALPEPAWDIYLVYGPSVRWDETLPPKPDYWMHQLGTRRKPRVSGPYLEPPLFLAKLREVLPRSP